MMGSLLVGASSGFSACSAGLAGFVNPQFDYVRVLN